MKRVHKKNEKPYRPFLGMPYKRVALLIAEKINETSLEVFDDLDIERMALAELWKRVFPQTPFPNDAEVLRRRYDKDPNIVNNLVKQ